MPENTLPAFEAAWESGAPWVEADTQPTADGVPVILHDDDLDRTTSGSGPVRRHSFAEVSGLDIVGGLGSGVPTLAALLALMPAGRGVLLEIKGEHSRADVAEILRRASRPGTTTGCSCNRSRSRCWTICGPWYRTDRGACWSSASMPDPLARVAGTGGWPPTTRPTGTCCGTPEVVNRAADGRDRRRRLDL